MTVARPDRPPTPLETAKQHIERALGEKTAKRVDTFEDGTFYVRAGGWAGLLSWLVDFLAFVFGVCAGFVGIVLATWNNKPDNNVLALLAVGLLVAVPLVYGLLFLRNGRGLGGVLTGTRLVRAKNGGRIGASASWAMFVRILLFPPFLVLVVVGGSTAPGSLRRISIADDATRRLHAAGFLRLQ